MTIDISKCMKTMRKYGAVFENVELIEESGSFTVRAIDKNRVSLLKSVPSVLIPAERVEIDDERHFISKSFPVEDDLREVFDSYLGFILSDERIKRQEEIYETFISMPEELKIKLLSFGLAGLFKKRDRRQLKIGLGSARTIIIDDGVFLMPVIDFMNHSFRDGLRFDTTGGSVTVKGMASSSGELFATYNGVADAFSMLNTFAFVSENILAFSMSMEINIGDTMRLSIGRELLRYEKRDDGLFLPQYTISDNSIKLSHLWLGNELSAETPYKSFKRLWEEKLQQTDTQKIYSLIKGLNITMLVSILRMCDSAEDNLAVEMTKEAVWQQLRIIGESYET